MVDKDLRSPSPSKKQRTYEIEHSKVKPQVNSRSKLQLKTSSSKRFDGANLGVFTDLESASMNQTNMDLDRN